MTQWPCRKGENGRVSHRKRLSLEDVFEFSVDRHVCVCVCVVVEKSGDTITDRYDLAVYLSQIGVQFEVLPVES